VLAAAYLQQWHDLRDARNDHPAKLTASNGQPTPSGSASVHFTKAPRRVDLHELAGIVAGAEQAVYFLMFQPGGVGVLADVKKLAEDKPKVLVRGVVSQLPGGPEDEQTGDTTRVRVTLFGTPEARIADPKTFEAIQPEGKPHTAANWAIETTRGQFLGNVGRAIIHSKVLVVDPFSAEPTVVTGSHNFSSNASDANDENFVVVKGDSALAEAYLVNIASAWRHYAGRSGNDAHAALTGIDYLRARLKDQERERAFWGL
jgi:phosphatidylserine/phosphatidylglycerophosphate/cardiolipin synthase-like enzyme